MNFLGIVLLVVGLVALYFGWDLTRYSGSSYAHARDNAIGNIMEGGYYRWLRPYSLAALCHMIFFWLTLYPLAKILFSFQMSTTLLWLISILFTLGWTSLLHWVTKKIAEIYMSAIQMHFEEARKR